MKIRLIGQRNTSGIGIHYTNFCNALLRRPGVNHLVQEVDFTDSTALQLAAAQSEPSDINISFVGVNLQDHFRGRNIQWTVFETTRPADSILDTLRAADQVWVPSEWGRNVLLNLGLPSSQVLVVPEGVDSDCYYPPALVPATDPFVFLFVGKCEPRKCLMETMQAFANTYGTDASARLVVKTGYFRQDNERTQALFDFAESLQVTNIELIYDGVSAADLWTLYQRANAFVFPSRGEAWGLPLIEAAAQGIPLITTNWSGSTEFLSACQSSVVPVDFVLAPVHCEEHKNYYPATDGNYGQWAFPQVSSIERAMRRVRENYPEFVARARQNSRTIRDQFNWTRSVDRALQALNLLDVV